MCKLPPRRRSSGSRLDHTKTFGVPFRERNAAAISDGDRGMEDVLRSLWNISHLRARSTPRRNRHYYWKSRPSGRFPANEGCLPGGTAALGKSHPRVNSHSHARLRAPPRKDKRGLDLISDALPFARLWYTLSLARNRICGVLQPSHHAVIRVYVAAANVIRRTRALAISKSRNCRFFLQKCCLFTAFQYF